MITVVASPSWLRSRIVAVIGSLSFGGTMGAGVGAGAGVTAGTTAGLSKLANTTLASTLCATRRRPGDDGLCFGQYASCPTIAQSRWVIFRLNMDGGMILDPLGLMISTSDLQPLWAQCAICATTFLSPCAIRRLSNGTVLTCSPLVCAPAIGRSTICVVSAGLVQLAFGLGDLV